ncbi:MAG: aspartate aminotransferase family protein [Candidatus Methylomirabilia bacterium]
MSKNAELLKRAYQVLPGASLGSYYLPEGDELVIERGEGSRVWDVEGRGFTDYILGSGPMILGHAHPAVVAAITRQTTKGTTFYALNEVAIALAEKIVQAGPCAEAIKFCGSGAEATFYALRLARAATGRPKILKFEGGYHGHHDYAMMSVTPVRLVPFPTPVPDSAGIPDEVERQVLVAPFNDLDTTADLIERHRHELAAVIVEPLSRMLEPRPGFLQGLRQAARQVDAVLIFDEVVTGFRVAWGGAQELYGVTPDLACYGKIIGGGLPLAAVAGKRELLELANPRKKGAPDYAYVSGTLNGNPLSAAAGLATLEVLAQPGSYKRLREVGDKLRAGLREVVGRRGIQAQVLGTGPLANIYFTPDPIVDYRSSLKADSRMTQQLGRALLARGVLTNLAAKMYLSLAHSDAGIEKTVEAFDEALGEIVRGRCSIGS